MLSLQLVNPLNNVYIYKCLLLVTGKIKKNSLSLNNRYILVNTEDRGWSKVVYRLQLVHWILYSKLCFRHVLLIGIHATTQLLMLLGLTLLLVRKKKKLRNRLKNQSVGQTINNDRQIPHLTSFPFPYLHFFLHSSTRFGCWFISWRLIEVYV